MASFEQWKKTISFVEWQKSQCTILNCTKEDHDEFLQKLRASGNSPDTYGDIATLVFMHDIPLSKIKDISILADDVPMVDLY